VVRVAWTAGISRTIDPRRAWRILPALWRSGPGPHLALLYHAANRPDREAVVEVGELQTRRLTWKTLAEIVAATASSLRERGVGPGTPVAFMLNNHVEHLVAQQALLRLGAVAVLVGTRLKRNEIAHILDNADPSLLIIDASFTEEVRAAQRQVGSSAPVVTVGDFPVPGATPWSEVAATAPNETPTPVVRPGDRGGMIAYTSGTTGKAKGAARSWSHTGIEAACDLIMRLGATCDERHLVVCPLYHSAAPAFVAITTLLGGTTVLLPRFEPEEVLAVIAREKITSALLVPTMLVRLCALPSHVRARHDTSSLRWVMSGAAPLAIETARQFHDLFGPLLWNFYGSTETGMVTLASPSELRAHPGTIGRALRGNHIRLLDDRGIEVGPGQVGELFVRNSMLIAGYHRDAKATADSLRDGFFSVGDLASTDPQGYLFLQARKSDLVISGGVNIYPREIEDHLMSHPSVLEAAVVGMPDPEWGESLAAFVVLRPGHALGAEQLGQHCRDGLADYKRPRTVVFVEDLPRTPTGKVRKRELQAWPATRPDVQKT
jgi:fatty-acyl-CoA synthase